MSPLDQLWHDATDPLMNIYQKANSLLKLWEIYNIGKLPIEAMGGLQHWQTPY